MILPIEGKRMVYSRNVSDALKTRAGQPTADPGAPRRRRGADHRHAGAARANAVIGITLGNETITYTPGPLEALGLSVKRNVATAGLILTTLGELFTGDASPRQLMGPVGIAQLSGASAREGWVELFALMASISLNLGLLNLLPIPVLDGGHMAIMGMEAVARRDFSLAVKEKMLFAGFVLLMALMVTVIYNDLTRVAWIEQPDALAKLIDSEQRLAARRLAARIARQLPDSPNHHITASSDADSALLGPGRGHGHRRRRPEARAQAVGLVAGERVRGAGARRTPRRRARRPVERRGGHPSVPSTAAASRCARRSSATSVTTAAATPSSPAIATARWC